MLCIQHRLGALNWNRKEINERIWCSIQSYVSPKVLYADKHHGGQDLRIIRKSGKK